MASQHPDSQDRTYHNEEFQGDVVECPEYFDEVYASMLSSLDPTSPLHGENDLNYISTDNLLSNADPFATEGESLSQNPFDTPYSTLISTSNEPTGPLLTEEHNHSGWDNELLHSLSPDQPTQLNQAFPENSGPAITPPLFEDPQTADSISSTFAPSHPVRHHRGLPRRKSRYMINSPTGSGRATPISITPTTNPADPLERWKQSPPEGEAASLSAIQNALENPSTYSAIKGNMSPNPLSDDLFQKYRRPHSRAASTASGESATSASSRRSNRSNRSSLSVLSSGSQATSERKSVGVRKNKATTTERKKRSSANNPRIFCCTFCCDKFKSKYDWMRHEKSLHLNLENWICTPFGGSVELPSTGRMHCAYCNQLDPTHDHLEQHNHGACQAQTRMFQRKDHLLQHLRLFHRIDTIPLIENWKHVFTEIPSRCGFCDHRMSTWTERADHLTQHFRKGYTMAQWKGDHEFPPEIAAQVRWSVPPYMLDFESRSFVPFSATDKSSNDHLSQMLSRANLAESTSRSQSHEQPELQTPPEIDLQPVQENQLGSYTEVLTHHLSQYAQRMMRNGIIPTDEMFQTEARRLLFGTDDEWDQTMADNLEWLAKFRGEQGNDPSLQIQDQGPRDS